MLRPAFLARKVISAGDREWIWIVNRALMEEKRSSKYSDAQVGMDPSLHQDLGAALGDRLLDLSEYFVLCKDIGFGTVLGPVERAELALVDADVGVIDVPVDDKGDQPLGMQTFAHAVRQFAERQQIGML